MSILRRRRSAQPRTTSSTPSSSSTSPAPTSTFDPTVYDSTPSYDSGSSHCHTSHDSGSSASYDSGSSSCDSGSY